MHPIIPQIFGILAVILFLLSYQCKRRQWIIFTNVISRVFYILQYLMLGAYEGALLDVLGTVSSLLASRRDSAFLKKHTVWVLPLTDAVMIAAGIALYVNPLSLFPVFGVLLHTTAFWLKDERIIRRVSLAGSPFWLIYNLKMGAYGSAAGDLFTMVSIVIAMIKYKDFQKRNNTGTEEKNYE